MKIHENMSLERLAEIMGPKVTIEEARKMRELLVEKFDGWHIGSIHQKEWFDLVDIACGVDLVGDEKFESLTDLRRWVDEGFGDYDGDDLDEMVDRVVDYIRFHDEFRFGKYVDMKKIIPDDDTFLKIAIGETEE